MAKLTAEEKVKFVSWGRRGGNKRWAKEKATRKQLLDSISGQVDKEILDIIQMHLSNEQMEKLLRIWDKNGKRNNN